MEPLAIVNKQCRIYDVATRECPLLFESSASGPWALSRDGRSAVGADQLGQLQVVDLSSPNSPRSIGLITTPQSISMSPDGQLIAMCGMNPWKSSSVHLAKLLFRVPASLDPRYQSFEWHPSSRMLAIGPYKHGIELWDIDAIVCVACLSVGRDGSLRSSRVSFVGLQLVERKLKSLEHLRSTARVHTSWKEVLIDGKQFR